jgi:glutamyl-tRNA synthetase
MNGVYIRELPVEELARRVADYLDGEGPPSARGVERSEPGRDRFERAVAISQEKIQTLADFWPLAGFLFDGPADGESDAARAARERWLDARGREVLAQTRAALAQCGGFAEQDVQEALTAVQQRLGVKPREVYQPLRVALAGTPISPGIFESVALLGQAETVRRIDAALALSG